MGFYFPPLRCFAADTNTTTLPNLKLFVPKRWCSSESEGNFTSIQCYVRVSNIDGAQKIGTAFEPPEAPAEHQRARVNGSYEHPAARIPDAHPCYTIGCFHVTGEAFPHGQAGKPITPTSPSRRWGRGRRRQPTRTRSPWHPGRGVDSPHSFAFVTKALRPSGDGGGDGVDVAKRRRKYPALRGIRGSLDTDGRSMGQQ